nr:immunoglobulin heavy chain junction region [Mus musculus]MBK4183890.1 immunoglobulin heavy chain junction region [Mus musculus]
CARYGFYDRGYAMDYW